MHLDSLKFVQIENLSYIPAVEQVNSRSIVFAVSFLHFLHYPFKSHFHHLSLTYMKPKLILTEVLISQFE